MQEASINDEALALDEIMSVGPGGHHLGTNCTRRHSRDFWTPSLFGRVMHDGWQRGGSLTLKQRVEARASELRSNPPLWQLDEETQSSVAAGRRAGRHRIEAMS